MPSSYAIFLCMVLVTANKAKRLLCFRFIDHVTPEEIRQGRNDLDALLADFPAGFRLLTDLDRLQAMDADCAVEIGHVMDLLKESGVELVVRVIPDSQKDIGLNILSVFHYGRDVRSVTCESLGEAFHLLKL